MSSLREKVRLGSAAQDGATVCLLSLCLFNVVEARSESTDTPYQANGVKVGEVTQTSAILSTRLTTIPVRRNHGYVLNKDDAFEMHDARKTSFRTNPLR